MTMYLIEDTDDGFQVTHLKKIRIDRAADIGRMVVDTGSHGRLAQAYGLIEQVMNDGDAVHR